MTAATSKSDLQKVNLAEWSRLDALCEDLPENLSRQKDEDGCSIKDVLAHRAHWIGLFFQWLSEGADGGFVAMPDHGVKWNRLKQYNIELRLRYADMSWNEVLGWLAEEHSRLIHFIDEADDALLYGGPMPGGSGWTIGRYAEAAGASHYRSAAKYIRSMMRTHAADVAAA